MKARKRLRTLLQTHGLRIQLMLYFFCVSIAVMSVGSYLIYSNMTGALRQKNEELVLQQFNQAAQNINNLYAELGRMTNIFISDEYVQQYFDRGTYAATYEDVAMVNGVYKVAKEYLLNYAFLDSIYLLAMDREAIGMSRPYSLIASADEQEHPFFNTELYQTLVASGEKRAWGSGYTRDFFNEAFGLNPYDRENLISYAEQVSVFLDPKRKGVLVFNISEPYLRSMYDALADLSGGKPYIVDTTGKVVSSTESGQINAQSGVFGSIDPSEPYGSVTLNERDDSVQLIYSKMPRMRWWLVKELPLTGDAAYAFAAQRNFVFATALISIAVVVVLSFFWVRRITKPLHELTRKMADMGQGNLRLNVADIPNNEIGRVIHRFNDMSANIADLVQERERMQEEKRALEFATLQAQINPHFLYNTLNTIKWMAASVKDRDVVDALVALGNILRPVFKSSETMWALRDESVYLENYAKIMNWRYHGAVRFEARIEECLMAYRVPRFILQPLVENAIVHGLPDGAEWMLVTVTASETQGELELAVADTGRGFDTAVLEALSEAAGCPEAALSQGGEGCGIGISNVIRRIQLYYGGRGRIAFESAETGGAVVRIALPKDALISA